MFSNDQYELLDFGIVDGIGKKLERFSNYLVARPSPPADGAKVRFPELWKGLDAAFNAVDSNNANRGPGEKGKWTIRNRVPENWFVQNDLFRLNLKPTPFGHLGVFAEQQENWDWIHKITKQAGRQIKVLNLFAYTGGSTLAAAAAGAEVVHIDSAKNIVTWARENAEASDLKERPIRWIVEDCSLFVKREVTRGNRYDAIILDPPSFGHGPKNEVWKLERDLIGLLRNCKNLFSDSPEFFLLSCHSPGLGVPELQATVCDAIFGTCSAQVKAMELNLKTNDSRKLNSGFVVRWSRTW